MQNIRGNEKVSESTRSLSKLPQLRRNEQDLMHSPGGVVCLRPGLMVATWLQFSKSLVPHHGVNKNGPLCFQKHALYSRRNLKTNLNNHI